MYEEICKPKKNLLPLKLMSFSHWDGNLYYVIRIKDGIGLYNINHGEKIKFYKNFNSEALDYLLDSTDDSVLFIMARIKGDVIKFYSTYGNILNDENISVSIK